MAKDRRLFRDDDIKTSYSQINRFSRNYSQGYTTIVNINFKK